MRGFTCVTVMNTWTTVSNLSFKILLWQSWNVFSHTQVTPNEPLSNADRKTTIPFIFSPLSPRFPLPPTHICMSDMLMTNQWSASCVPTMQWKYKAATKGNISNSTYYMSNTLIPSYAFYWQYNGFLCTAANSLYVGNYIHFYPSTPAKSTATFVPRFSDVVCIFINKQETASSYWHCLASGSKTHKTLNGYRSSNVEYRSAAVVVQASLFITHKIRQTCDLFLPVLLSFLHPHFLCDLV